MNCFACGSWTVRGANFCHNCGQALATNGHSFESSIGGPGPGPGYIAPGKPRQPIKDKMGVALVLAMGASVGALFDDWSPAWIALAPMGYVLFEPVTDALAILLGKMPKFEKSEQTTLRVEHFETSQDGKRFVGLYDLPQGIELCHLQHIAEIVLDPPIGEGMPFSRLKVCKPGKLTQGQFYALRDSWLGTHHAFYRDPAAPNRGLILTERCTRILKKSVRLMVVD